MAAEIFMEALTDGIVARIVAAQGAGGSLNKDAKAAVLEEDTADLTTQINVALDQKVGMLILVGQPHWKNSAGMQNPNTQDVIDLAIAIGENPPIWRLPNSGRHKAKTVAHLVERLLHNYKIEGFQFLQVIDVKHVPDRKRNLYEVAVRTQMVLPTLTG